MELDQQLKNDRQKRANIRESHPVTLQKYKQELHQREQQGERADTLEGFRTFVSSYEISSAKQIEGLEAEIADLERRIDAPEYQAHLQARERLEGLRETAHQAWLAGGGLEDDFEANWIRIKQAHLQKQVLEAMAVSMETAAREVR
jgi:hypothetical protein